MSRGRVYPGRLSCRAHCGLDIAPYLVGSEAQCPLTGRVISPSSGIQRSCWRRSPRRPPASEARTTPTARAYKPPETCQGDARNEPDKPRVPQASHEAHGSGSSSGPASTAAASGRIYRSQPVPEPVKRRRPCNAGGAAEAPSLKRGLRRSRTGHIDGPGTFTRSRAAPLPLSSRASAFRRYPLASATPTLPAEIRPGGVFDAQADASVRPRAPSPGCSTWNTAGAGTAFSATQARTSTPNLRSAGRRDCQ